MLNLFGSLLYHFVCVILPLTFCCLSSWGWVSASKIRIEYILLFSRSVVSDSWTAAHQASLFFTISRSLLKLMSVESVMPSNHVILCHPLLLLTSLFPSIRVCLMSRLFTSGGQIIGTSPSASVLLMNIQDWFPLGFIVWPPCNPGDSQEFSPAPQLKSINSLAFSFLYGPALTCMNMMLFLCNFPESLIHIALPNGHLVMLTGSFWWNFAWFL